MPLPLLFIGAAAVSGVFGVGKSIKAGVDQKDASDTNDYADRIVKKRLKKLILVEKTVVQHLII